MDVLRQGALAQLLAALCWLGIAWLIASVLGGMLAGDLAPWPELVGLLGLGILRAVLTALSDARLARGATRHIAALCAEILATEAATTEPSAHGGPGALAALLAEKTEALRPYLTRYQPARLRATVLPLLILALAFWHSWAVGLVLLMAGPLIPVFMALVGWAAKDASARQMAEVGSLSDLLADRIAALPDLRLIGAGEAVTANFAEAADRLRDRTMAVLRVAFLSSTVLELFAALGVAMVAVWVGFFLLGQITWGGTVTPVTGIFLLLLAPDYFQPLRDLAAAWHDKAAAEAIRAELDHWRADTRPTFPNGSGQAGGGPITLRGVTVRDIRLPDMTIAPGDRVALVGPSGAGKTTLLRVLAGLQPCEGGVAVDSQPLDDIAADWRARLGWMPQAPAFPARTLRHVIAPDTALRPEIIAQSALTEVVARLPRGLLTPLGERGAGLSGGEARRVMLARALHGAPQVLLADEPTADLDPETAHAVTEALLAFPGTLVVATHDPVLAARMDRVIRVGS